jgi:hypothetical protein
VILSAQKAWFGRSIAAISAAPARFTAAGESATATATTVVTELVAKAVTAFAMIRPGASLAHGQLAAAEIAAVESLDSGLGFVIGGHFDKAKTAMFPGLSVDYNVDRIDLTVGFKGLPNCLFGGVVRHIANIDIHKSLVIDGCILSL